MIDDDEGVGTRHAAETTTKTTTTTTINTTQPSKQTAHPHAGRIIFVTGRQGAGKSAVANGLAAKHGFAHLDGDHWSCREDVKELRTTLTAYMVKYRDENNNIAGNDDNESESWQPFYAAMCAEAIKMNKASPNTGVLVSHSLYRRSHRAFVQECLGTAGLFLVLAPPPALALQRAAIRCADQYSAMGKTVEEWEKMLEMNSAGFQEYDPELEGDIVEAFVLKNDGTEQTVAELLASAEKLLGLTDTSSSSSSNSS